MTVAERRVTETGGRSATTRHIPPKLALAVGMPSTPAPPGWRWAPLTELARLESGHTPSRKHPEYWGGSIPWIGIQDAKRHHGGVIEDTTERTNALGIANSSARVLPENTVCLSRTASVGYVVVMGRPMATSQDFVNWVCSRELDHNFLKYLFMAEGEGLLRFASGAVHQTIYFPEVKAFHVCVPSLREQRHIVALLDAALGCVATAETSVKKSLDDARALFDNQRRVILGRKRASWAQRRLGDLSEVQSGGTPAVSNKTYWGGDVPWYSSGELNHIYTLAPQRHITRAGLDDSNAKLFPKGSLLIGMYDTAALKMSILDRSAAFNQAVAAVKPREGVELEFVLHAIQARRESILSLRRGVRQKNLSLAKIKDIPLNIPPLSEQRSIVLRLRELASETSRLTAIGERKLAALEELRQSLLRRALTGAI